VVAGIVRQPEKTVGVDRVGACTLELVSADLVDESDATSFLPQIEKNTSPLVRDGVQRTSKLGPAVAVQAEQGVARQALRMNSHQHRLRACQITRDERGVFLTCARIPEAMQ